jgi:hypothetical protein
MVLPHLANLSAIYAMMALIGLLSPILLYRLWRQSRHQYQGLGLMFHHAVAGFVGVSLLASRETLPKFFAITTGSACVCLGAMLGLWGVQRILGQRPSYRRDSVLLVGAFLAHALLLLSDPGRPARIVITLSILAFFYGRTAFVLFFKVEDHVRPVAAFSAWVASVVVSLSLVRLGFNLASIATVNLYQIPVTEAVITILIQVGITAFDFSLILLVAGLSVLSLRQREEALAAERDALKKALSENRALRKLLPVCAWCHKVRNDQGYWSEVREYFTASNEVTHGVCPDCANTILSRSRAD